MITQHTKRYCRAIVIMAHGKGQVLYCEPGAALDFIHETMGMNTDAFSLDAVGADYDGSTSEGLYVGHITIVDNGPGDWPGSREYVASLSDLRSITKEEWVRFVDDELPWDAQADAACTTITKEEGVRFVEGDDELPWDEDTACTTPT